MCIRDRLYRTLHRLAKGGKRLVIAIAGNHDSPDRVDSPDVLARQHGIFFVGDPRINFSRTVTDGGIELLRSEEGFSEFRLPGYDYPLRVIHTPYANSVRLSRYLGVEDQDEGLRAVLHEHWKGLAEKYCDEAGVNLLVTHLYMKMCIRDRTLCLLAPCTREIKHFWIMFGKKLSITWFACEIILASLYLSLIHI